MSLKLHLLLLCVLLVVSSSAAAQSHYQIVRTSYTAFDIFRASRLDMMGTGDLADPGPATVLINPAPLIEKDSASVSFDHAEYFLDISFNTYAAAVSRENWVADIAVQQVVYHPEVERTAFEPGGTGRIFQGSEWMAVLGLSYDLASLLMSDEGLRWSVGGSWHNYWSTQTYDWGTANTFDLGMSASQRTKYAGGWATLSGSFCWQNVFDNIFRIDGDEVRLKRALRAGLTVTTAVAREGHELAPLAFTLAYSRDFGLGKYPSTDSDHMGAEALLFHLLALRYGYNSLFGGGRDSWGLGILLDDRLLKAIPVEVELNLGRTSFDNELFEGDKTIFGARAQYHF